MKRSYGVVGALAAVCLAGCADPAGGAPSAQPAAIESEAVAAEAPIASSSAAATSEVAVLSAEKPPVPSAEKPAGPSASARAMSEARKQAITNELNALDLNMSKLSSLHSSRGALTDNVLRGDINQRLNDAAASGAGVGRAGGLNMGSGEMRAGGGGGGLSSLGSGGRTVGSTIGGKSAKDLTSADLDAALTRAGCKSSRLDSPSSPPAPALFEAKCSGDTFTVTFVPAGVTRPDAKTIAEMDRLGTTWSDSGMLLAIVPKEKASRAAAVELMNKLRASESGGASKVSGPKGNAAIGGASVSGGSISNAGSVVAGMAAGFRRCYNRGLQEDANMKGSVRITAKIGADGEVLSASPSGGGGLSATVTSCVSARVASAMFAAPEGGSATIVIPVSFFPAE